jgi:hypothetical protein
MLLRERLNPEVAHRFEVVKTDASAAPLADGAAGCVVTHST